MYTVLIVDEERTNVPPFSVWQPHI